MTESPVYSFRKAEPSDIDAIIAINKQCLPENYEKRLFEKMLYSTIVCCNTAGPVGYIILANILTSTPSLLKYSSITEKGIHHAVILSLAMLSEHRKKGNGKELLIKTLNASQSKHVALHVRKTNESAIKLYKSVGFVEIECLSGYYKNPPDDGLIMVYTKP